MAVEDIDTPELRGAAAGDTAGSADAGEGVATLSVAAAATRSYKVAAGVRLNVRSGPGTQYGVVRVLPEGASVPIICQRPGQTITGPYGTTKIWDCIGSGQYVSDSYVHTGSDGYVAPLCG